MFWSRQRWSRLCLGTVASAATLTAAPLQAWGATSAVDAGAGAASTVAVTTVNVRAAASSSASVLATLIRGQRAVPSARAHDGWQPIKFEGTIAYVASDYLAPAGTDVPDAPEQIDPGQKVSTTRINLRSGPSTQQPVQLVVAAGTTLGVTAKQEHGFAYTTVGSRQGWVSLAYLADRGGTAVTPSEPVLAPAGTSGAVLSTKGDAALAFARAQLGKPYRFGATGPSSWDCSGLTQAAWRAAGIAIPRTSQQQFTGAGQRIPRSALRAGDLVFFYGSQPSHVGLYVGGGRILAAPRPGRSVSYTTLASMPFAGAVRPG